MAEAPTGDFSLQRRIANLPDQPGIYVFRGARGELLYVGKALNLRKRVTSYCRPRGLSPRMARMVRDIRSVEVHETASEAEALLLEAQWIKQFRPRFNVSLRDDKTYPMLKITREPFPRLVVTRRRAADGAAYFGPYPDAGLMHDAVRFMRRVFPLRTCRTFPKTPCLEYHLGQCLAPCAGYVNERAYQRIVNDLLAFLRGERDQLLRELSRRMAHAARTQAYEEAARVRNQLQALTSVIIAKEKSASAGPLEQLQAALKLPALPRRIEAFDISNIFGTDAVGSMVVFVDGRPHKAHYRRFQIETVQGSDDYRMMAEVIRRRYGGSLARELPFPDLILVDGGKGQLSAANEALRALQLSPPTLGLAKRFEQLFVPGQDQPIVLLPTSPVLHLIQRIRDEAHRFAVTYHRRLRGRRISVSALHAVPGIGRQRAAKLLRQFGSVASMRRATLQDLRAAEGIGPALAQRLVDHLRRAPAGGRHHG